MKAAIYTRISRDRTGEHAGVTRQLEDCEALAATLNWPVLEVFSDNDTSATSGKPRPEYERMLKAMESGEIDAVLAWHTDRLYRQMSDLERLITVADKAGAAIKTCRAGELDLSTPTGRMLARILGAVAKQEGEAKADRWMRSIRQRRENGQAPGWGWRLFGYTRTHEIVAAEADAISWAAQEIIEGASLLSVTRGLTDKGFTSTRGNRWTIAALKKLMTNARLAGHSVFNGDVVGIGAWEPILTPEVFEQVQSALHVRRGTPPGPRIAVLANQVHCARCGAVLVTGRGNKSSNGDGQRQRIYRCKNFPGMSNCGRISIAAEPLEEMVEAYAQTRLEDPKVRQQIAGLRSSAGSNAAEIISLEERRYELEQQYEQPGVPAAAITRAIDKINERVMTLRSSAVPSPVPPGKEAEWPGDLGRRSRLVRLVVAGVIVGPAIVRGRKTFEDERVRIVPR